MSAKRDSPRNTQEQKKLVSQIKNMSKTGVQKKKDDPSIVSHSQDADRHHGIAHQKSGK